jgi:Amt family ammonium transporter
VLATGLFASKAVNPQGANGLFFGNPSQLGIQAIGVVVTVAFSGVLTFIILKAMSLVMKLRESPQAEEDGMDITQHGETAYPDMSND